MKKMLCLLLALLCAAPALADVAPIEVPREFSYHFGSFNGGYWEYELEWDGGRLILDADGSNGVDLDIEREVDPSVMDELALLIDQYALDSWDGFKERDPDVLDGYDFELEYERGGREIEAKGYMRYPENYDEAHKALTAFFEALCGVNSTGV